MKWFNSQNEKLPSDKQLVLLSVNGIYYEAVFQEKGNLFVCSKHENITFSPKFDVFFWTSFTVPEG